MKKILIGLVISLMLFPAIVNAKTKVKVYMFEAGGCPYCEAQEEYLKGLSSYGTKFELIKKELYVDHINWAKGADYNLGVTVAKEFNKKGFTKASSNGTPFVVISDIYAASVYSTSLESVINEAYEKGDKDIVGCISKGKTDCLDHLENVQDNTDNETSDYVADTGETKSIINNNTTMWIVVICTIIIVSVYLVKSNADKTAIINSINNKQ